MTVDPVVVCDDLFVIYIIQLTYDRQGQYWMHLMLQPHLVLKMLLRNW